MPQEVILLKLGEIALKGLNRKAFEDVLLKNIRRRLQDLGLVPGAVVECVAQSPLGTPSAYRIRGAVIALRKKDAQSVLVTW